MYGVSQHAIFADRCFATTIADNYIEEFGIHGGNAGDTWYGIACRVQSTAASLVSGNKIFRFVRPKMSAAAYTFLDVGANGEGGLVSVIGNIIRGHSGANTTGLSYTGNISVLSGSNVVDSVLVPRYVAPDVTIVQPL